MLYSTLWIIRNTDINIIFIFTFYGVSKIHNSTILSLPAGRQVVRVYQPSSRQAGLRLAKANFATSARFFCPRKS